MTTTVRPGDIVVPDPMVRAVNRHDLKLTRQQLIRDIEEIRRNHDGLVEVMHREQELRKQQIDTHFELKSQHFVLLEKSIDARFFEIAKEIHRHSSEDERTHTQIMALGAERMQAAKDLLTAAITGVTRSNDEVKEQVKALSERVTANNIGNVAMDTYNEFKRGVEAREKVFNDYMLSNQGRGEGIKNFWGQIVAAAVGGAALVSMIQFVASHIR
jgi:hypothetical protein